MGCDCTGIVNTIQSAIESNGKMAYAYGVSEMKRMHHSNTFYPIAAVLRAYAKIFDDYKLLDEYYKIRNIELYNLTEGSLLNNIKQDKLENIISAV